MASPCALAPESSRAALARSGVLAAISEAEQALTLLRFDCAAAVPDPAAAARHAELARAAITRVADRLVPPGGAR